MPAGTPDARSRGGGDGTDLGCAWPRRPRRPKADADSNNTNDGSEGGDDNNTEGGDDNNGDDSNNNNNVTPQDSASPQSGDTPQGTAPAGAGADGDTPQDGGTSPAGDGANESDDDEFANAWPVGSGFPNPNDLEFDPSLDLDEEPEGLTYNCDPDTNIIIKTITGKVDQQKFNMRPALRRSRPTWRRSSWCPRSSRSSSSAARGSWTPS